MSGSEKVPHAGGTDAKVSETAAALAPRLPARPVVGVVLGSGLGPFADTLEGLVKTPYATLPHLAGPQVDGHAGNFCAGAVRGVPTLCMQGRVHLYEGHSPETVVHGVRTMARLGAQVVLLTNAAGGIEASFRAGDLMLVSDHLNLTGLSPLRGPHEAGLGPRFPDLSRAYHPGVAEALRRVAQAAGIPLREGVYAGLLGPTYETPAEVRMLRGMGADAVGMSTVLEVIALRALGVRVGALSCITNLASGLGSTPLSHAEVEATARSRHHALRVLLEGWIAAVAAAPQEAS